MAPTVCDMNVVATRTSPQNVAVSAHTPKLAVSLSMAYALVGAPENLLRAPQSPEPCIDAHAPKPAIALLHCALVCALNAPATSAPGLVPCRQHPSAQACQCMLKGMRAWGRLLPARAACPGPVLTWPQNTIPHITPSACCGGHKPRQLPWHACIVRIGGTLALAPAPVWRACVMDRSRPDDLTASPSAEPPMASITTFHRKLLKSSCAQHADAVSNARCAHPVSAHTEPARHTSQKAVEDVLHSACGRHVTMHCPHHTLPQRATPDVGMQGSPVPWRHSETNVFQSNTMGRHPPCGALAGIT